MRAQLFFLLILFSLFLNHASAQTTPPMMRKVFVLIFDPIMSDGRKLSVYRGWQDPRTNAFDHAQFFRTVSNNRVQYEIVSTQEFNYFPRKQDGFVYDQQSYLEVVNGNASPHRPDDADFYAFLNDPNLDICGKLNRGEIHELWLYGGPWFGFWESSLATSPSGPPGFPYNGATFAQTGCNKLLPMVGMNYEKATIGHHFAHRVEATMAHVYGNWEENRMNHAWDKFGLVAAQSPAYNISGCGSVHWPPNAQFEYDYANLMPVQTFCDTFFQYPNLPDPSSSLQTITCAAWGCSERGYFEWWFRHLPSFSGRGSDGKLNDWWFYFLDPNVAAGVTVPETLLNPTTPPATNANTGQSVLSEQTSVTISPNTFSQLSAKLDQKDATFQFKYSGQSSNYIIETSTNKEMSRDRQLFFASGVKSPVVQLDPEKRWDKYRCGMTIYWRIHNANRTFSSEVQASTIECSKPSLFPTLIKPISLPEPVQTAIVPILIVGLFMGYMVRKHK